MESRLSHEGLMQQMSMCSDDGMIVLSVQQAVRNSVTRSCGGNSARIMCCSMLQPLLLHQKLEKWLMAAQSLSSIGGRRLCDAVGSICALYWPPDEGQHQHAVQLSRTAM